MAAATQDPFADAAIGNVTGSNGVNVSLGLGLPWLMAAIYWKMQGAANDSNPKYVEWKNKYTVIKPNGQEMYPWIHTQTELNFIVPAGDLGISVATFTVLAISGIGILMARR